MTRQSENSEPNEYSFDDIYIDQEVSFYHTVTDRDLELFTELTGDYNPIHHSDEYAEQTQFGSRIIPGLLTASFISRIIGMYIPGKKALYLSQNMKFIKPIYIGDTLLIKGTVTNKFIVNRKTVVLKTEIFNQHGAVVLTGTAKAMVRD